VQHLAHASDFCAAAAAAAPALAARYQYMHVTTTLGRAAVMVLNVAPLMDVLSCSAITRDVILGIP
jgi:hypothetical protein